MPLSQQRATLDGAPQGVVPDTVGGSPEQTPQPRKARDIPLIEEQDQGEIHAEGDENPTEDAPPSDTPAQNATGTVADYAYANSNVNNANSNETAMDADEDAALRTPHYHWPDPTRVSSAVDRGEEEFVNGLAPEYEDSNEPGSALGMPSSSPSFVAPTKLPPVLLELHWLPPAPPTRYDGFSIYISRDGMRRSRA